MAANLQCQQCKTEFLAKRSDAKWCPPCRGTKAKERAAKYELKSREPCPNCSTPMIRRAEFCLCCSNKERGKKRQGENNGNWKLGFMHTGGYVYQRVSNEPGSKTYRPQHHIVWEETYSTPVPDGWVVHHLNGVKDDNRPENLAAMPRQEHHSHPREALVPYEERIRELEELVGIRV